MKRQSVCQSIHESSCPRSVCAAFIPTNYGDMISLCILRVQTGRSDCPLETNCFTKTSLTLAGGGRGGGDNKKKKKTQLNLTR